MEERKDHAGRYNARKRTAGTAQGSFRFMISTLIPFAIMMMLANNILMNPWKVIRIPNHLLQEKPQQQQQFAQSNRLSEEEGLDHIRSIFKEANITLTPQMLQGLPTWNQIQDVIGTEPILYGYDTCAQFQSSVPPIERMLGSAGMFNTGTNLMADLLKRNCEIPERRAKYGVNSTKEAHHGMLWQVPWGKHAQARSRLQRTTRRASAVRKEYVLPVVSIRNPYTWFQRMCTSGYVTIWEHDERNRTECPNLKTPTGDWNQVKFGVKGARTHQSLAHFWNDWYHDYYLASDFPRIIVRLEDLIYYAKETTTQVCECAGGRIRTDQPFQYVVESAKTEDTGHEDASVGFYKAWLKYAKPYDVKGGLRDVDYDAAVEALDGDMMRTFGYEHPPSGQE